MGNINLTYNIYMSNQIVFMFPNQVFIILFLYTFTIIFFIISKKNIINNKGYIIIRIIAVEPTIRRDKIIRLSSFISCFFIYLIVLLGMSFFTLLERKALGYFQLRKGPNKVGFIGVFQPFADALKLFTKEINFPLISNIISFLIAPVLSLILALLL